MSRVLTYHFFLTPRLIYDLTPVAVLTAVLVTFGVLTKHNEVTAFKACGISVYRLTAPVLLAGLFLSGSSVRVRSLLGARSRPPPGRDSRRDQGQARANLSAARSPLDLRPARSRVLLPVFRPDRASRCWA